MAMSRFDQANRSITKGKDFRDDIATLMQPYVNWEQYLTPAPVSIALLGELVRISAGDDFSINKNPPKDGFKFIRYPESFRACLMQVCNAGWQAFNQAHKNMDQIRMYTGQVPEYIKNVVGIIVQENTDLVKAFLPAELQNIERISSECLQLAEKTEGKFSDVINLMQEFAEALVNARQGYDVELEEIKKNIEEKKMREISAKEANKRAEEAYKKTNEQLAEAMKDYKQAIASIPSGWELLLMKLLSAASEEAITFAAGAAITHVSGEVAGHIYSGLGVIKVVSKEIKDSVRTKESTTRQASPGTEIKTNEIISANNILSKSDLMLVLSTKMSEFYNGNKINLNEVYDQKTQTMKSDFLKKMLEDLKQKISKEEECLVKTEALSICDKGICICTELAKCAPKEECDDAKTKELIEDIKNLNTAAKIFDSKSKAYTNRPPLSVEPPHSSRQQTTESMGGDVIQMHANLARLRMEQSEAMFNRVTEMHARNLENMEKNRKELDDILIALKLLEPKMIDFNQKIKVLAKGLEAMGRVKDQWEKLVRFFQIISNIVKTTLTQHLNNFNQTIDIAVKNNYTYDKFVKDKIYINTLNASAYAYLVNMISTTYTEVSVQYLMDSVSTLGKLMTLDPNGQEFISEMTKLQLDCENAQEGISSIALKNKKEFELRCSKRITQIQAALKPVLPPISDEENEKLKKIVQDGFKAPTQQEDEAKPAPEIELLTKDEADQFV
ncbi:hypothetical protein NFI96_008100 [Prochilodus magdalenae]|nr:hypothetical protein NFI96_008100 [Prochilodus magdalenae]